MMRKRILVIFLLLLLAGVGFVFITKPTLRSQIALPAQLTQSLEQLTQQTPQFTEQTQLLSERAQVVGTQAQQVLGTAIQAAPEGAEPAANRALEYGKYLYCKQVVEDYENN